MTLKNTPEKLEIYWRNNIEWATKWMRWKASNETVTRLPQNWRRLKATGRQSKENAPRSHIELFPLACIFRIAFIHFNLYRNIFRIILVIKIELSVPSACRERDFIDFECWLGCSIKSNHLLFAVSLSLRGEGGLLSYKGSWFFFFWFVKFCQQFKPKIWLFEKNKNNRAKQGCRSKWKSARKLYRPVSGKSLAKHFQLIQVIKWLIIS